MRSNILNKSLQRGRKGNPLSRIDALEQKNNAQFFRNPSADRLTDITQDLGTIMSGSFIAPAQEATSAEPTDTGFTGAAMGGDGWTFDSVAYHFVAVAAGVLQAGFNSLGKLIAGAGAVTLDKNGLSLQNGDLGATAKIKWYDGTALLGMIYASLSSAAVKIESYVSGVDNRVILYAEDDGSGTGQSAMLTTASGNDGGTEANLLFEINGGEALYIGGDENRINGTQNNVDTNIYGTSVTPVVTVDAGLNAVGLGGAAESGKILKATGDVKITGGLELGTNLPITEIANGVDKTSFTPVIEGTTAAGAGTYTTQIGYYSRVFNIVFWNVELVWTAHTGTGNMRVGGLPYAAASLGYYTPASVNWSNITLAAVGNKLMCAVLPATATAGLYEVGSGALANLPIDTAGTLRVSGFYFV